MKQQHERCATEKAEGLEAPTGTPQYNSVISKLNEPQDRVTATFQQLEKNKGNENSRKSHQGSQGSKLKFDMVKKNFF